jgi:hypothetical protein
MEGCYLSTPRADSSAARSTPSTKWIACMPAGRGDVAGRIVDEHDLVRRKSESGQEQFENARIGFCQSFPAGDDDPVE